MAERNLYFNGLNGSTGRHAFPARPLEELARQIRAGWAGTPDTAWLRDVTDSVPRLSRGRRGLKEGPNPTDLSEAGWGIVFAGEADPAVREALQPLLAHRRSQAASRRERRYREFASREGYQPNESKRDFLARYGAGPGPVDPDNVPYYLLLVGDPEAIPFGFQYQLDVQYAVGRLNFDTPAEYASYAESVVAAETAPAPRPRQLVLFGVRNAGDEATELTADCLVEPLAKALAGRSDWQMRTVVADEASKERLGRLLGGPETPTLLFTACHGVAFEAGDPLQRAHQGALVCQHVPGEPWRGAERYFAADDLADAAVPRGLIVFHFACYGGGTPRLNSYAHRPDGKPEVIAPHSFIARLPQRLLGHPRGGALAVVAHVDRAWTCSFLTPRYDEQVQVFDSTLQRLMQGHPVGYAMDYFNIRYAELEVDLSQMRGELEAGREVDDEELVSLWTATHDARSYLVLGDPAVRVAAEWSEIP